MYKYLLYAFSASAFLFAHEADAYANFKYKIETERTINVYGNNEDGPGAENCPGTDEFFEAFKIDEVNFDFDKSNLNRREGMRHGSIINILSEGANYNKAALDRVAKYMMEHPHTDAHVVGYTDIRGSHTYNEGLGQRRADSAIKYLVSQGVDRSRLHAVSVGERQVKYSNHFDNRHVDINLQD